MFEVPYAVRFNFKPFGEPNTARPTAPMSTPLCCICRTPVANGQHGYKFHDDCEAMHSICVVDFCHSNPRTLFPDCPLCRRPCGDTLGLRELLSEVPPSTTPTAPSPPTPSSAAPQGDPPCPNFCICLCHNHVLCVDEAFHVNIHSRTMDWVASQKPSGEWDLGWRCLTCNYYVALPDALDAYADTVARLGFEPRCFLHGKLALVIDCYLRTSNDFQCVTQHDPHQSPELLESYDDDRCLSASHLVFPDGAMPSVQISRPVIEVDDSSDTTDVDMEMSEQTGDDASDGPVVLWSEFTRIGTELDADASDGPEDQEDGTATIPSIEVELPAASQGCGDIIATRWTISSALEALEALDESTIEGLGRDLFVANGGVDSDRRDLRDGD